MVVVMVVLVSVEKVQRRPAGEAPTTVSSVSMVCTDV